MIGKYDITKTDPEDFQAHMQPLVGPNRVRPARGAHFHISVHARQLDTLGMFTVSSPSLIVDQTPPLHDIALNIPVGSDFSVAQSGRKSRFSNDAYLRLHDRPFHFEAGANCRCLVAGLGTEQYTDYACMLGGLRRPHELSTLATRISLVTPAGTGLIRGLARLWSDLQTYDPTLTSPITLAEREDEVITQFVLATQGASKPEHPAGEVACDQVMALAEDYLCAHLTQPVSRANLAAACGVTIRTLSRGFTKRWGTGPMGFLKMQRMNAAYRELLGAKLDETNVTEVAYKYGFSHLGNFALDYKQAFHESPSLTLQH